MPQKIIYRNRKFLNKKGSYSTALIFVELIRNIRKVESTRKKNKKDKDHIWYDAELKISDCDRMINLSIDTYSIGSAKNTLFKLNILINVLQSFRDKFTQEMNFRFKTKIN